MSASLLGKIVYIEVKPVAHAILMLIQSRHAVVWNARFHQQDHLNFVEHLINDFMICLKRFIFNEWFF